MSGNDSLQEKDAQPTYALIQQIKDGTVAPETLTKDLRQRCVEVLLGEGYAVASMAQILKRSEKTIKRDIEDIREQNAIAPDLNLAKKIIGEMVMYARLNRGYLMKLARTKDTSVAEKAQSEYYAFKVLIELVSKLQTLGFLPLKPKEIIGDVYHHNSDEIPDMKELEEQIIDVENLASNCGQMPSDAKEKIDELKIEFRKIKIARELKKIQDTSKEGTQS